MIVKKEILLEKNLNFDYTLDNSFETFVPLVFLHGFKGFKDWGHYPLMAEELALKGFAVFKLNFSHNGIVPPDYFNFSSLDLFGKNTFSKEIDDVKNLIDWVYNKFELGDQLNFDKLTLMGHSRGGATSVIYAANDSRIKSLITLAAVSDLARMLNPRNLEDWKKEGVLYTLNGRTNQQMPLYYSLREDYYSNIEKYNVLKAASRIKCKTLIIHGDKDEAVPLNDAMELHKYVANSCMEIIKEANHTFNGMHPYNINVLPDKVLQVINLINNFIK